MSLPSAGTRKNGLFSQQDYLAPLPIPTGEMPSDVLNIIWRRNDVFLDIGNYSPGAAILVWWPMVMLFFGMASYFKYLALDVSDLIFMAAGVITGIPALILIHGLFQPTPLPIRFNRQRREVCVPRENGEYWIVPWESVTAAASQHSSVSQAGKNTVGMLFVGFDNPDPLAKEDNKHFFWGFNCGGGETAMALWECMRSYMEVGPDAVTDKSERFYRPKGILATYANLVIEAAQRKGWFMALLWEGFCGLFIFNILLIDVLERIKLNPPPDLNHPDIIEWSKPLPPEQWAKRSPELEDAIAKREAELAVRSA